MAYDLKKEESYKVRVLLVPTGSIFYTKVLLLLECPTSLK